MFLRKTVYKMQELNRIQKNVRHLRERAGKTKSWVADQLSRSPTIISNYEKGKVTPPIDTILAYADLFGVKASDIIDKDLESDGLTFQAPEEPQSNYSSRSRIEREKDLLHQELDLRLEEIRILHASIRRKPEALAELKALDPELYEELERLYPREDE